MCAQPTALLLYLLRVCYMAARRLDGADNPRRVFAVSLMHRQISNFLCTFGARRRGGLGDDVCDAVNDAFTTPLSACARLHVIAGG